MPKVCCPVQSGQRHDAEGQQDTDGARHGHLEARGVRYRYRIVGGVKRYGKRTVRGTTHRHVPRGECALADRAAAQAGAIMRFHACCVGRFMA
eukprot:4096943-Prymnesium_polylepis.1